MIKVLYAGDYAVISKAFLKGMNSFTFAEMFDERNFLTSRLIGEPDL